MLGSINGINNATADTKVGIGTTAPTRHLHVAGPSNQEIMIESTDTGGIRWTLQSSSGASNGRFEIIDRTANASRMTILGSGNMGIGITAPADKLHVNGDIRIGAGANGCVKDANANIILGTCSSDLRLKKGIRPFARILDKLVQLQPVNFYWRAGEFPERNLGSAESFGLIAQEVEKVMPELVTEDAKGFKLIHYHKLPLLMLEGIKELRTENDGFRQQIRNQQNQIDSLKKIVCLDHPGAELCR
ncbi:MAG TPA: tail fiber domain-containing protein [Candidatus Polarisedimenticolia bacterium]|nr:tail fiber domain-containing protein [Candidatus Polarisedimenticolia bacterium]